MQQKPARPETARMIEAIEKDGGIAAVRLLLREGYSVDQPLYKDVLQSALHFAAKKGRVTICRLLLDAGAKSAGPKEAFSSPLHEAVDAGKLKVAKLLIERGADVNARNRNGEVPLYKSAHDGMLEMTKMLVEAGGDLSTLPNEGHDDYWTPFEAAVHLWDGEGAESPGLLAAKMDAVTYLVRECGQDPNPERLCSAGYVLRDLATGDEDMEILLRSLHIEYLVRQAVGHGAPTHNRRTAGFSPL